jgi:hypothetical protein
MTADFVAYQLEDMPDAPFQAAFRLDKTRMKKAT